MNPQTYPKKLRDLWYLAVAKHGKSVTEVCQTFGISRKTYYKWYRTDHGRSSSQYRPPHKRQPSTKLSLPRSVPSLTAKSV